MSMESVPMRWVIAASFTAEPVAAPLAFWGDRLGQPIEPVFAPFGQVFQQLLDPASALATATGVAAVLVRIEDLDGAVSELAAALRAAAQRAATPVLLAVCPPSPARQTADEQAARELLDAVADVPNIHPVPVGGWYRVPDPHDAYAEQLGGVPYSPAYFAALGTALHRTGQAIGTPRPKVLVVDCDNTLWDGAVGEEGADGVHIGAERRAIMALLAAQAQAGRLICLASRNAEADVLAVLDRHPDLPLRREHLTATRINWLPKSANIASLAAELDLGLDSFVFLDDSPVECAEVAAALPEVLTLRLPGDAAEALDFLRHCWPLDIARVTAEDTQRTARYQAERDRRELRASAPSLADFLAGLDLAVEITPPRPDQLERAAQLTQRTNQFNLSLVRTTAADLAHSTATWLAVHVTDRFGDYGMTGLIGYRLVGSVLRVEALMLSCRVLGRGVEHRVLAHLGTLAEQLGAETVELVLHEGDRNQPARDFLASVAAPGPTGYTLAAADAAQARPVVATQAIPVDASSSALTDAPRSAAPRSDAELVAWIATELGTPEAVLAAMGGPVRPTTSSAEATPLQLQVMALWAELLGEAPTTVADNFFALGGQSLQVVQFMARARQAFGVELPVDLLFTPAFTVAEVSAAILALQLDQLDTSISADLLDEIEALSEEELEALLAAEETGDRR
ncbi:FkbH-like protein [Allocatelliglobosispora scoriae]|uniref:FkbH-like protein n=1 Tax=Allocatelliglobosispora scoriae TaxID=643052 RepID=A0A841C517_9ACTN|nr:HAD-IIIC family phosphatase [Allocatelliglobosispora scoriae]MBB5873911.1 FkbH-like protein [Allocatelliglobosispora scoriae]